MDYNIPYSPAPISYPSTWTTASYTATVCWPVRIRRVANGWIMELEGQEHVATDPKALNQMINDFFKEKKK
jgi:hypothetical protein